MSFNISTNFRVGAQLPLDAKSVAIDIAARNSIPSIERYQGLAVYVVADMTTYQLQGGIADINWVKIFGGTPVYPTLEQVTTAGKTTTQGIDLVYASLANAGTQQVFSSQLRLKASLYNSTTGLAVDGTTIIQQGGLGGTTGNLKNYLLATISDPNVSANQSILMGKNWYNYSWFGPYSVFDIASQHPTSIVSLTSGYGNVGTAFIMRAPTLVSGNILCMSKVIDGTERQAITFGYDNNINLLAPRTATVSNIANDSGGYKQSCSYYRSGAHSADQWKMYVRALINDMYAGQGDLVFQCDHYGSGLIDFMGLDAVNRQAWFSPSTAPYGILLDTFATDAVSTIGWRMGTQARLSNANASLFEVYNGCDTTISGVVYPGKKMSMDYMGGLHLYPMWTPTSLITAAPSGGITLQSAAWNSSGGGSAENKVWWMAAVGLPGAGATGSKLQYRYGTTLNANFLLNAVMYEWEPQSLGTTGANNKITSFPVASWQFQNAGINSTLVRPTGFDFNILDSSISTSNGFAFGVSMGNYGSVGYKDLIKTLWTGDTFYYKGASAGTEYLKALYAWGGTYPTPEYGAFLAPRGFIAYGIMNTSGGLIHPTGNFCTGVGTIASQDASLSFITSASTVPNVYIGGVVMTGNNDRGVFAANNIVGSNLIAGNPATVRLPANSAGNVISGSVNITSGDPIFNGFVGIGDLVLNSPTGSIGSNIRMYGQTGMGNIVVCNNTAFPTLSTVGAAHVHACLFLRSTTSGFNLPTGTINSAFIGDCNAFIIGAITASGASPAVGCLAVADTIAAATMKTVYGSGGNGNMYVAGTLFVNTNGLSGARGIEFQTNPVGGAKSSWIKMVKPDGTTRYLYIDNSNNVVTSAVTPP